MKISLFIELDKQTKSFLQNHVCLELVGMETYQQQLQIRYKLNAKSYKK